MSLITLKQFQDYTKAYGKSSTDTFQQIYIDAAEKIVINYLGYDPIKLDYKLYYSGNGKDKISLYKKNINSITKLTINDTVIDVSSFSFSTSDFDELVYYKSGTFTAGYKNIYVEFNAGANTVPDDIQITVLRIAALLQTEANGNIGITSKTFDNSGTRTFIQTRKYDDYLIQVSNYKIIGY